MEIANDTPAHRGFTICPSLPRQAIDDLGIMPRREARGIIVSRGR